MAFQLKLSTLSKYEKEMIVKNLMVKAAPTQYDPHPKTQPCFIVDNKIDEIKLPLGVWQDYYEEFPNTQSYDKINAIFTKTLLTADTDPSGRKRDQDVIVKDALEKLKKNGFVFLSVYTGGGKTLISIYLSIYLGYKTVILSHLDIVKQQWGEEYAKFSNVKVQFLNKPNLKLDPHADVYIIGIQKALSATENEFKNIGTVIIDEAHICTITAFTQTLFKFQPRYLIGLSATPDRNDGFHSLFNLYFGSNENFIVRKEKKPFTVYKVETDFEPEIKYKMVQRRQTVDWNTVVNSLDGNEERWQMIVDIILNNPTRKIMVLCNRKVLSKGVYELLIKYGEDAELLIETKKTWNKQARVLVAGFKKGGTGLNDESLNFIIIASDTRDARQYEGRNRQMNGILYHIVDKYEPLQKHYKECEQFYLEKGATVNKIHRGHVEILRQYYKYLLLKHFNMVNDIKGMILTEFIYLFIK